MVVPSQNLALNARLLKSKVNKYAVWGVAISFAAIVIATIISAFLQTGAIALDSIFEAQVSNMGLWFLDAMPFVFAVWGAVYGYRDIL